MQRKLREKEATAQMSETEKNIASQKTLTKKQKKCSAFLSNSSGGHYTHESLLGHFKEEKESKAKKAEEAEAKRREKEEAKAARDKKKQEEEVEKAKKAQLRAEAKKKKVEEKLEKARKKARSQAAKKKVVEVFEKCLKGKTVRFIYRK